MPVLSNSVDLCQGAETKKISQVTQAITNMGISPKCPVPRVSILN